MAAPSMLNKSVCSVKPNAASRTTQGFKKRVVRVTSEVDRP